MSVLSFWRSNAKFGQAHWSAHKALMKAFNPDVFLHCSSSHGSLFPFSWFVVRYLSIKNSEVLAILKYWQQGGNRYILIWNKYDFNVMKLKW